MRELKSKEEVKKEISSQIKSFISTTSMYSVHHQSLSTDAYF